MTGFESFHTAEAVIDHVDDDDKQIFRYSQNGNFAIRNHVDSEDKLNDKTALSLGRRGGWLINESGLYSLAQKIGVMSKLGTPTINRGVSNHHPEDKQQNDGVTIRDPIGRDQKPTVINEPGLYASALGSRKPVIDHTGFTVILRRIINGRYHHFES